MGGGSAVLLGIAAVITATLTGVAAVIGALASAGLFRRKQAAIDEGDEVDVAN